MGQPDGSGEPEQPRLAESDQWNLRLWEKCEETNPGQLQLTEAEIQAILDSIFAQDYEVRQKTIDRLTKLGPSLAKVLVDTLIKNTTNNTLLFQLTYALEVIGKTAIKPLMEELVKMQELKTTLDVAQLENITETLIRLNDNSAAPVLARHIKTACDEIARISQPANSDPANPNTAKKIGFHQSTRLKLHDLLGDMKAADGLDDLMLLLGDGRKRVHEDVVETIFKIGDKRALLPLIRLYSVESTVSELGARYIKLTFREITRREKISRTDQIFKELNPDEKKVLADLFPGSRLEARNHNKE
ncbi:MAG: hypothetical protein WC980_06245 [Candidatus Brocadiia bacterium]